MVVDKNPDMLLTNVTKAGSTGLSLGTGDLPHRGMPCAAVVGTGTGTVLMGNLSGFTAHVSTHLATNPVMCTAVVYSGHDPGIKPP